MVISQARDSYTTVLDEPKLLVHHSKYGGYNISSSIHDTEYSFSSDKTIVGAQMLFVAFGALVLVPLLTGLDPNVAFSPQVLEH